MRRRCVIAILVFQTLLIEGADRKPPQSFEAMATAHSEEGETAAGTKSRAGVAAADPSVLPLGSRIRVQGAGRYSGVYTVEDTGRAIKGREIDLYMKTGAEAKKFGRQRVRVTVLEFGKPR